MLTLFAIPKAFRGQFKIIQTNAIRSWTLLRSKPEIILLGDDEGTAEIAKELGLRHIPDVEQNEYGTPLLNSVFQMAQVVSSNELLCYVNSDIILMNDFTEAPQRAARLLGDSNFVMIGRKISVELHQLLNFTKQDWQCRLREFVKLKGELVTYDTDYFVFFKGMLKDIPPFAIGRCFWTQWLIFEALRSGVRVVDASRVVQVVESKHDYTHVISTGGAKRLSGPEYVRNRRLFKDCGCKYSTTVDATHILTHSGLEKTHFINRVMSLLVRSNYYVYFLLKGDLYPYSIPFVVLVRWTSFAMRMVFAPLRKCAFRRYVSRIWL